MLTCGPQTLPARHQDVHSGGFAQDPLSQRGHAADNPIATIHDEQQALVLQPRDDSRRMIVGKVDETERDGNGFRGRLVTARGTEINPTHSIGAGGRKRGRHSPGHRGLADPTRTGDGQQAAMGQTRQNGSDNLVAPQDPGMSDLERRPLRRRRPVLNGTDEAVATARRIRSTPGSTPAIPAGPVKLNDYCTTARFEMKAVRIHSYGGPEQLQFEADVPDPHVSATAVLIQSAAASVNPIDWKVRSGARQKDFPLALPAILGRDVAGIVQAVGSSVHNFKVGDRVAALANATYAELVAVEASLVTHLPDGIDLKLAAAIPLAALTGDQLVRVATRMKPGDTILVSGAVGSVGRAALHTAKKLGARVIAGVRTKQLAEAESLGAWSVVAIDDDQAIGRLEPLDAVADTVGNDTAVKLLAKVRTGGSFGYASVLAEEAKSKFPHVEIKRVFGKADPSKVREFADDIRDGKYVLPISRRMPLSEAAAAHRLGEQGGSGKILLETGL